MEELTSHKRCAISDTVTSLQGSEREVIKIPEIHDLLGKIHDILDKEIPKQVRNATCI